MHQLNPEAKKILFYRILWMNLMWLFPVLIFLLLFVFSLSYLPMALFFILPILLNIVISWLWSKKIVGSFFWYEVADDGLKIKIKKTIPFLGNSIEIVPYDQIINLEIYQDYFDRQFGLYSLRIKRKEENQLYFSRIRFPRSGLIQPQPIEVFCGFSKKEVETLRNEILLKKGW